LLYPVVFRRILEDYLTRYKIDVPPFKLRHYSFLQGQAPQHAGYETLPISDLFTRDTGPKRVVIGGGDLLRTDWKRVAEHYLTPTGSSSDQSPSGDGILSERAERQVNQSTRVRHALGTSGLINYSLRRFLPGSDSNGYFTDQFREIRMNYPSPGPFVINPKELTEGSRVVYLSCGVPHDFTDNEADSLRRSLEAANFIYVRDQQSADKLRQIGLDHEIHAAPDLIVTLSDQYDYEAESKKGRELLNKLGVDTSRPVLCFQSKAFPGFSEAEIARELMRYRLAGARWELGW
jgi:Polysaccharide pyruvyl transferase